MLGNHEDTLVLKLAERLLVNALYLSLKRHKPLSVPLDPPQQEDFLMTALIFQLNSHRLLLALQDW